MLQKYEVIIIGAGAAGLMCAAQAAQRGRQVLVLDHANKAGKKILMSGGGRCNFTNYYVEPDRYLSHNPHFCKSALSRYTQWDFIALVDKYGIAYHEKKGGQLFCDNKASDILNMLLDECQLGGARIQLKTSIDLIEPIHDANDEGLRYQLQTSSGRLQCQSLVIATGGPSIRTLGATGFGYDIARQFNLDVYPTRAGLVPFVVTDHHKALCESLSGTSLNVAVRCNNKSFSEDLLFTHRGLSGPAILQISSYWAEGDAVEIDLLPSQSLSERLRQQQHQRPKVSLKNWLAEFFTQKFAELWLQQKHPELSSVTLAQLSGADMDTVADNIHQWQVKPSGTEGYRTAEVALGGVNTDLISSKSMEVKQQPGLFFIGEVLDVTGHLGGFNFQWAWASAVAAAECV